MAMSADASCRGLHNSRVGPLVLQLSKGEIILYVGQILYIGGVLLCSKSCVREYVREYVRACVRAFVIFFAFLIGQICIDWVAMLLSITRIVLRYASTDVNGWPNPSCSFPDWLVSLSWRDLAGKQIFNSNGSSQTFVRFTRRKSGAKLHRRSEYRCIGTPPHVTDDDLYTVLTFSTHEW